jgi:hypothetical protein
MARNTGISVCVILGLIAWLAPVAPAQENASTASGGDLAAQVQAIKNVVDKQQQLIEIQQRQIEELKAQGEKSTDSMGALEAKMQKVEKTKPVELPSWMDGLKFSGDLRMRYEGIWLDPRAAGTTDDQRGRFRLRFGFEKKVNDDFDLGLRLASGKDTSPITANQTFTDDFSKKPVWIDLAYMLYHPVAVPGLTMGVGKFKNPYVNTDMVWSGDLNPEGAYESYKFNLGDKVEPFITLGQNMLTDNTSLVPDGNLLAYQGGAKVKFTKDVSWVSAATYYDYIYYALKGNFTKANGNTVAANGNLAAEEFNVIDFPNIVTFPIAGIPVSPYFDYAKNVGDEAIVEGGKQDTAWATGVQVGDVKTKGDWAFTYKYARIEADSVVGAFNDEPFNNANTQGSKVGAAYGLAKNVTLGVAAYFTKPVTGANVDRTTLQADLVFKF